MPLSTYTGTTELTTTIPADLIDQFVAGYNYPVRTAQAIAWSRPGQGNVPVRFQRWGAVSVPAGTKSETVALTDVNVTSAESTITPGIVGMRMPFSREGMAGSDIAGIDAQAIAEGLSALMDRMDSDTLSSITSATSTTGAVTDEYTLDRWLADKAAYRALDVPLSGLVASVQSQEMFADLESSLLQTGATFALRDSDSLAFGPDSGFKGTLHGFAVFCSSNTPTESTGHAGCMTPLGAQRSGLGIVMNGAPTVEMSSGDDALARQVKYAALTAYYGTGLTNPARILETLGN